MGPLPKRKLSKGKKHRRRSHDAIGVPQLVQCPNCNARMLPHRVCSSCGHYRGRHVVDVSTEKES